MNEPHHLMVTPPDVLSEHIEGYRILLVDAMPRLVDDIITAIEDHPTRVILYCYSSEDSDLAWLMESANSADQIVIDFSQSTQNEVYKGYLTSRNNACYTEGVMYKTIWNNHTADPVGLILNQLSKSSKEVIL